MLVLLTIGMLSLAFNIQPAKSEWTGTVYIRADGSIDPPDAPIISYDNTTYTLTGNIMSSADGIVVERDNIIIDGTGYIIQGSGSFPNYGICVEWISNVTIRNISIKNFKEGIRLTGSSNNRITENNITNCHSVANGYGIAGSAINNSIIYGNNIENNDYGIQLYYAYNTNIAGNNVTANKFEGIWLYSSDNNTISENNIANNSVGINLDDSSNNIVCENNIADNTGGIRLKTTFHVSLNNIIYHNNFMNNHYQAVGDQQPNMWNDTYPSGGNYWSDYDGTDFYSGPYQNETGSDGVGDTSYIIDENNQDHYPLMRTWPPQEHDLSVSLTAPTYLQLGGSIWLNATVKNEGLNNEISVRLSLLINGTTANSTTIPLLRASSSYTLTYPWAPTAKGTYNITAYVEPVSGETYKENNQETKFVTVSTAPTPPEVQVGVKAGDWTKVEYTITGWPAGQPYPEWLKVEFLTVEGTNATVRVTMHMSDGTEQNATVPVIIGARGGEAFGLSGFIIPANLTVGDSVYISGYGNVTLAGETTRTYAGASRTVVYASFSQYGTQLTYYWDKQTGVMVEASTTSGSVTATAKATETNLWQAAPSCFPIEPIYIIAIAIIIIIIVAAILLIRKRKT